MRMVLASVALLMGISAASVGVAQAGPTTPVPVPSTTSSDDELTDMVMDAIAHGDPAPSTTPVVAPPR
jgi:hypothetical protein